MVFVISKEGEVLMPTKRYRKVRQWLSQGQAKVISRAPFTLQLLFDTISETQPITLGVDTGHNEVGLSAVSQSSELFSAAASMRNDISKKMTDRKMYRRNRRNRLRYRKPRFLNRKASNQPKDRVRFEGKQYQAISMQNKGAYLKMTNGLKPIVKSMKKIEIIFHQKGVIYA